MTAREDFITLFGKRVERAAMERFKREYEMALQRKDEQFKFDGQDVLVAFARYVLQYAESEMGPL